MLSLQGGFEFVSPVLAYAEPWEVTIRQFFDALESDFSLSVDSSCGTHIHVSTRLGWSLRNLRNVSIAALTHEAGLDTLMPFRSNNVFCQGNGASAILAPCRMSKKSSSSA